MKLHELGERGTQIHKAMFDELSRIKELEERADRSKFYVKIILPDVRHALLSRYDPRWIIGGDFGQFAQRLAKMKNDAKPGAGS